MLSMGTKREMKDISKFSKLVLKEILPVSREIQRDAKLHVVGNDRVRVSAGQQPIDAVKIMDVRTKEESFVPLTSCH